MILNTALENKGQTPSTQLYLCLFVLKTLDIENVKKFYEKLGFLFSEHRHKNGPIHYCSENLGFPFEIYPATVPFENHISVGFKVKELDNYRQNLLEQGIECSNVKHTDFGKLFLTRDPDNNRIEIYDQEA